MQIQIFKNSEELISQFLVDLKTLAKTKPDLNLAISGGKTPIQIYQQIDSQNILDYTQAKLFQVDERHTTADSSVSNQFEIYKAFQNPNFSQAFKPINVSLDYSESVLDYNSKIENLSNQPKFDLTLLGFGTDGHFASIFSQQDFQDDKNWVIATQASTSYPIPNRISLSPKSLLNSQEIVVFLIGENKKPILQEFLFGDKLVNEFPAKFWYNSKIKIMCSF